MRVNGPMGVLILIGLSAGAMEAAVPGSFAPALKPLSTPPITVKSSAASISPTLRQPGMSVSNKNAKSGRSAGGSYHSLDPFEEAIVRYPFASPRARLHLAKLLDSDKPDPPDPDEDTLPPAARRNDMGFSLPDRRYWKTIPPAARDIPNSWKSLPVVYFTNTQIGGVREVRFKQGPVYDQWLLNDREHDLKACISVKRSNRRIYFMQFDRNRRGQWKLRPADDNCFSCHPSGPRVIRPFDEKRVDHTTLAAFNRLILSYGACDYADTIGDKTHGPAWQSAACASCHNGVIRGKLFQMNIPTIHFKLREDHTMPPVS